MQKRPDDQPRKVLPRWRTLSNTPSPELASAHSRVDRFAVPTSDFEAAESDWRLNHTLEAAVDVVSGGAVLANRPEVSDAARFILRSDDARVEVKNFASAVLERDSADSERSGDEKQGASEPADEHLRSMQAMIAELKCRVRFNPRNAIAHVDLARVYASSAQSRKAQKHFEIALGLAAHNRFVLRSAARFYIHDDDAERAHYVLSKCTLGDPWIDAARVAVADQLGLVRRLPMRRIRSSLDADLADTQKSELAAAIATVELGAGATKKSKRLFHQSAAGANDNTVAQLRWADEQTDIGFDKSLLNVDLSFEARASFADKNEDWKTVVEQCEMWLLDEPFSIRPVFMAGYVASEFLQDYKLALKITKRGLDANRDDPGLLNNAAFAAAALGHASEAKGYLKKALKTSYGDRSDRVLTATSGFLEYRKGNIDLGRQYYKEAMDSAYDDKNMRLAQQIFLHWLHEEMHIGAPIATDDTEFLRTRFADGDGIDTDTKRIFKSLVEPKLGQEKNQPAKTSDPEISAGFGLLK